jgi:hypothetical protein
MSTQMSSHEQLWIFRFALEREDGAPVERELPERLLGEIVRWAEANGCQIGGGYRPPSADEAEVSEER